MTRTGELAIVELQTEMKDVRRDIADLGKAQEDGFRDIAEKLDELNRKYATKTELKSFKWVTIPVVIVATTTLTFLITYFLQNISKKSGANDPTTSSTTTTNTPTGSTSTTNTRDGAPSANATAEAQSSSEKPTDSQTSNGGVDVDLPKVLP